MISLIERKKIIDNNLKQQGFSLLEILIALLLSSILIGVVVQSLSPDRNTREQKIKSIKRMIRFAKDEAIINNRTTRIVFTLGTDPKVEVQIADDFDSPLKEIKLDNEDEIDKDTKEKKNSNRSGFSSIKETEGSSLIFQDDYYPYGVATNTDSLIIADEAVIYFYPTGEKDAALILLVGESEMTQLSISPFQGEIMEKSTKREKELIQDEIIELETLAKTIYEKWIEQ